MGETTSLAITIVMVIVTGEAQARMRGSECDGAYDDINHPLLFSSPWSNEYDPPLADGTVPSTKLRKLEVQANDAFDTYREMLVYELPVSATTMMLITGS